MATIEALQPRLRQLKLSGIVDSIAARIKEVRARPLDPLDFLLLLLEDELVRRESEWIDRYIHRAHFDEVCDLRDFNFAYNPEIPKARIWELASGRFVEERASILLCGATGVGKNVHRSGTRRPDLASAPSRRVHKTNAFLADLAGSRAEGNWESRLRRYLTPDLVILDAFVMREYTLTQAEDLYELVKGLFRRGSLILTSNREPKDLYELFPTPVMADGLLDRLLNSAYMIGMLGSSYRPQQRPGTSTNTASTNGGELS